MVTVLFVQKVDTKRKGLLVVVTQMSVLTAKHVHLEKKEQAMRIHVFAMLVVVPPMCPRARLVMQVFINQLLFLLEIHFIQ